MSKICFSSSETTESWKHKKKSAWAATCNEFSADETRTIRGILQLQGETTLILTRGQHTVPVHPPHLVWHARKKMLPLPSSRDGGDVYA
ncbi:hypothetical protein CHARACLAT_026069 [Characodon lateralis]|uniref:Uncharacterized protein n=1 Tax=Characodon lateralis TaxID=208331 RepID=A0ABU7E4A1_9TELE|nr:hypothetical protein [Characodon lateralis]